MSSTPAPTSAPLDQVCATSWEVAVVGGGPAGAVAALALSARGRKVLLIEAKSLPREKVCGDALLPDALQILSRLGLEQAVRRAAHLTTPIRIYSPSRLWFDLPMDLVTLRRSALDLILVAAAVDAGTVLFTGRVEDVRYWEDGQLALEVARTSQPIRSRVVLLATGAQVGLLRNLGMLSRVAPNAVAIRGYLRSTAPPCQAMISYDRSLVPGYGWIFPMGDGEYNVGVGLFGTPDQAGSTPLRERFSRFLREFPPAHQLIQSGEWLAEPRGAPLRCGLHGSRASDGRAVLAVGETLGTTYPFTGEGIGKAMASAYEAAARVDAALGEGDLSRLAGFDTELRSQLAWRYRSYATAQNLLAKPLFADAIAWWARRNGRLRRKLAAILQEWRDPVELSSGLGLVRLLAG
jgi:flavin-dependent dehydrogenase